VLHQEVLHQEVLKVQEEGDNNKLFLSLISPDEWKQNHVGSFKLKYNGKWKKLK